MVIKVFVSVVLGMMLLVALPSISLAHKIDNKAKWESGSLRYHLEGSDGAKEMRRVASILNNSGANIKLSKTSNRDKAHITISAPSYGSQCKGHARSTWAGDKRLNAHITWTRCTSSSNDKSLVKEAFNGTTRLLLHETLHAYGLKHEDKKCSLMNSYMINSYGSYVPSKCNVGTRLVGHSYCRFLEEDDIHALVEMYGGVKKSLGSSTCKRSGLTSPQQFKYDNANASTKGRALSQSRSIRLHSSSMAKTADLVGVWYVKGQCKAKTVDINLNRTGVYSRVRGNKSTTSLVLPSKGRYCLYVSSTLNNGYTGMPKRLNVTV